MKKLILITIFIQILFSSDLFSWDTEAAKYFPLSIGNSWTYYHINYQFGCEPVLSYEYRIIILSDSVINGHSYYKFSDGSLQRIDSNSMNVYRRNFNTDCLTDSLLARIGDHFVNCSITYVLSDTNIMVFGGQPRRTTGAVVLDADLRRLMYGIGLFSKGMCIPFAGGATDNLKGCVINGVLYGDTTLTSQDTSLLSYFPLKVGNVWVYNVSGFGPTFGCGKKIKVKAKDTLIQNGHLYFLFQTSEIITFPCGGNGYCKPLPFDTLRVDSINYNIYKYTINSGCTYSPHEILIDSLKARLNDYVKNNCGNDPYYKCIDTSSYNIFGSIKQTRKYSDFYFEGGFDITYVKDIGINRVNNSGTWGYCFTSLLGCVIDGIVYGDTSFVQLHSVSGTVRYQDNNQNVSSGYVKAYRHSYQGYMDVLDSAVIQPNGTYTLTRVPAHDTTDLMAFQNDEISSHDFVPTYFVSTIYWQQADHLLLNNDTSGIDINVYRITNDRFGSREISGGVYGYYNADAWKGISDARLYAVSQSTFRSYDISVETGLYSIDSLPSGQYQIICDRIGFPTQTQDVYLGNTNRNDINFYFDHLVTVAHENYIPERFWLYQNYPNPFNPVTKIKFDIPAGTSQSAFVQLKIYDVIGKEITTLINEQLKPGSYEFEWDASNYPSGVYFYKLISGTFIKSMKMVLIK